MQDNVPGRLALLERTTDIVSAYAGHNRLANGELPALIAAVFSAVSSLEAAAAAPALEPAIPINKSVTRKVIVCLECGKPQKMIKRHLASAHGLTPEDYRAKWRLSPTYPMVSADYSELRKKLAVDIGLGRKTTKRGKARKRAG